MTYRVLVADGNRHVRDRLAGALRAHGYATTVVADGITALEAFGAERPDVIVADVMLPGIDGLALCRTLRSEMHVTPILLLASRTATSDLVAGLNAGADDWMVQPVSVAEFCARLRALIRGAGGVPSSPSPNGAELQQ